MGWGEISEMHWAHLVLSKNEPVFIAYFMDRLNLGMGSNLTFLMDFKGTKIMCQLRVCSRSVKS